MRPKNTFSAEFQRGVNQATAEVIQNLEIMKPLSLKNWLNRTQKQTFSHRDQKILEPSSDFLLPFGSEKHRLDMPVKLARASRSRLKNKTPPPYHTHTPLRSPVALKGVLDRPNFWWFVPTKLRWHRAKTLFPFKQFFLLRPLVFFLDRSRTAFCCF
jgi:hypothetical protein